MGGLEEEGPQREEKTGALEWGGGEEKKTNRMTGREREEKGKGSRGKKK